MNFPLKCALVFAFIIVMEVIFKKRREQALTERITTPLSNDLKNRIENAKRNFGFDPHETIRTTLENACKKIENGELTQNT